MTAYIEKLRQAGAPGATPRPRLASGLRDAAGTCGGTGSGSSRAGSSVPHALPCRAANTSSPVAGRVPGRGAVTAPDRRPGPRRVISSTALSPDDQMRMHCQQPRQILTAGSDNSSPVLPGWGQLLRRSAPMMIGGQR